MFFEALDATVPDRGYVGLQKGPNDEVYFSLEALSETTESEEAKRYMSILLQQTALDFEYVLTLQLRDRA